MRKLCLWAFPVIQTVYMKAVDAGYYDIVIPPSKISPELCIARSKGARDPLEGSCNVRLEHFGTSDEYDADLLVTQENKAHSNNVRSHCI